MRSFATIALWNSFLASFSNLSDSLCLALRCVSISFLHFVSFAICPACNAVVCIVSFALLDFSSKKEDSWISMSDSSIAL